MTLTETYQNRLSLFRVQPNRLDHLRHVNGNERANVRAYLERIRLLIALFNDRRAEDYLLLKFLLIQEGLLRRAAPENLTKRIAGFFYDVDFLYLAAYLLTTHQQPADIWLFTELKSIDFDTHIGFDSEYLFAMGISATYDYVLENDHPQKEQLLRFIGTDSSACPFTEDDLQIWRTGKERYFELFCFPLKGSTAFQQSVQEDVYLQLKS